MYKKILFLIFLFFLYHQSGFGQKVIFPDVVLKDIPVEIQVQAEEKLDFIILNSDTLYLHKKGNSDIITVKLSDNNINFENPDIQFNSPIVIPGWLSLLPPLIAIALALIFKEVISSLFIGIFIGAATYGYYTGGFTGILTAFYTAIDHYILNAFLSTEHISVILFSIMIGAIVAVISKNGGMQGIVNHLIKFAANRKSGMLTTYFLGIAIFFDDYANSLVVGNTMRPITDKLKISREKLAYIVDSTAAPIAAVAFITTWIGAELTYISDGIKEIEIQNGIEISQSAYGIFINSLPYAFYSIFTLIFMYILLSKERDFGPMLTAERKAVKEGVKDGESYDNEIEEFKPVKNAKIRAYNAIIPISIIIFGTFLALIITGLSASREELIYKNIDVSNGTWAALGIGNNENENIGFFKKLGIVIGNADSYLALLWSSLTGLTVSIILTVTQRIMPLRDVMDSVISGIKTMLPAITVLILAWALADVTVSLNTAQYLKSFFGSDFSHIWIIPALTFVLAAFISFSTGSSWSTMAMLYPLVIPLSYSVASGDANYSEMHILYNTVASVLTGSILGDHCSPISDTTILSSLSSSCDHIEHVRTQMPYAIIVGLISLFIGVIPTALGIPSIFSIIVGIVLMYLIIHFFGKKVSLEK